MKKRITQLKEKWQIRGGASHLFQIAFNDINELIEMNNSLCIMLKNSKEDVQQKEQYFLPYTNRIEKLKNEIFSLKDKCKDQEWRLNNQSETIGKYQEKVKELKKTIIIHL